MKRRQDHRLSAYICQSLLQLFIWNFEVARSQPSTLSGGGKHPALPLVRLSSTAQRHRRAAPHASLGPRRFRAIWRQKLSRQLGSERNLQHLASEARAREIDTACNLRKDAAELHSVEINYLKVHFKSWPGPSWGFFLVLQHSSSMGKYPQQRSQRSSKSCSQSRGFYSSLGLQGGAEQPL